MKVALYARYSDDNQREASIADQFRVCRLRSRSKNRLGQPEKGRNHPPVTTSVSSRTD